MIRNIDEIDNIFFIGVAGTGMSALAQYLAWSGKKVSGSDRYFIEGEINEVQQKLQAAGIECFLQNGEGIKNNTGLVIVSTAVEDSVPEVQKANNLNIPILKRAELLALIAKSKKTIAIGGTSGKSTTTAMLFDILQYAGVDPGIISGAGLVKIIKEGKIGNAKVGNSEYLVIEADESDGSIIQYHPEIGVLLNVDKDHKEVDVLMEIFTTFKNNSKQFVVNASHSLAKTLSSKTELNFGIDNDDDAAFIAYGFKQNGLTISFSVNGVEFNLNQVGKHSMENALAAATVAALLGVDLQTSAKALQSYEGIYRRHQVIGKKNGVLLVDDYAHNPVKCAVSMRACQPLSPKLIAWLQPHGYGPTRFLRDDFVKEISSVLREGDEIWMSEIFYAGGTTTKDISANDLIKDIQALGKNAFFVEDRNHLVEAITPHLTDDCVVLLMGARDPSLEKFAHSVWEKLPG